MRVRIRLHPDDYWCVESKYWYNFSWKYRRSFSCDNAYERAQFHARALMYPQTEEI